MISTNSIELFADFVSVFNVRLANHASVWTEVLNDPRLVYVVITALSLWLPLQYGLTRSMFSASAKIKARRKLPPLVPYVIPVLGSSPFEFLWDPRQFIRSSKDFFWSSHPVRIKFLTKEFYILQGAENILALFKQHSLSAFALHGSLLRYVFRLPERAAQIYYEDDSGGNSKPAPDSSVAANNRVDFLTRQSFKRFLTGPGLTPFSERFDTNLTERLQNVKLGQQWEMWPDLMELFHKEVMMAVTDAMCGTALLKRNPGFVDDFWILDHNIITLFTRIPRIFVPKIHNARDRALAAIKDWHSWAKENFDPESVDPDGDDPFWGTRFFRERQAMFLGMDGFDAEAVASQELAFIWGANTNAVINTFWSTLETFRDASLLEHARREAKSCILEYTEDKIRFDIGRLLNQPILQAVYAETLRMRVNGFLVRCPGKTDLVIHDYSIPRNHFLLTSSTPGHMDPDVWSRGQNEGHPPEEFWPGRFLKPSEQTLESPPGPQFSLAGTEGSWMPYGGGTHACPGRYFAKRQIILTTALMITLFDCELLAGEKALKMDTRNFGLGALSPAGKVPVRIRRRASP